MKFETYLDSAGFHKRGLNSSHPEETLRVNGVMEIADKFDIVLFSAENTLIKNKMTLPAGAVCVPNLRRAGKKLAIYSVNEGLSKEDVTKLVNHLGFSFAEERILGQSELENLETRFPLFNQDRILMVCSDVMSEVSLGQRLGLATLLIADELDDRANQLGISPNYVALSV